MAGYWSYRMASAIGRHLPLRLAYWVGLRLADFYFFFVGSARRAVLANLAQLHAWRGIQPARPTLRGLARKTFQFYGKYLVDFFRYTRIDPTLINKRVSLEHPEYLKDAFAEGRGVIIVTAHLGNWELGGAVLTAMGYPVHAVVAPERKARVEHLLHEQRKARGLQLEVIGQSVRNLIRILRRGEVVALLTDRDFSGEHATLPFFDKPVHLPRGAAWLSTYTGAPILPLFLLRQPDDTFLLRAHPPIRPSVESPLEHLVLAVRDVLQREISENPCQWFVFHEFWKTDAELRHAG